MNVCVKNIFTQGRYFLKFLQYTNGLQFSLTAWCVVIKSVNKQSNISVKFCSPKNLWQACCYGAVSPGTCLATFSIRYIDNNEFKNRTQQIQNGEIQIDAVCEAMWLLLLFFSFNYEFLSMIPRVQRSTKVISVFL